MRKYVGRNHRSVGHSVDAAASFVLLVGIAIGAIVVAGIGRIVGWGSCP
jgi:hypothetical protein